MNRLSRVALQHAAVSAAVLAVSLFANAQNARADGGWDVAVRAPWIARLPLPDDAQGASAPSHGGLRIVLTDRQVRLGERGVETYFHDAQHVVGSAGVENVSEIRIPFDPSYNRLHLHAVRVHRDGVARDVPLTSNVVRTFYEESDEGARTYDGRRVALIVIPDVRVGDTLETDYTLVGDNPVFAGKYADQWSVGSTFDSRLFRFRLLTPPSRALSAQLVGAELASTTREVGTQREQVWTRENFAGVELEDKLPNGFDPVPRLVLSEYRSWSDVALWARALFPDVTVGKKGALADALRALNEGSKSQAEKALAAMHLVQDDVRYFGMELGENSHRPHTPEAVLAQRFGDCKDKAYLLVTLLRGLGIEAHVALVHVRRGAALVNALPSPAAFNHAIVHATLDGKKVFIDATLAHQGGTFVAHETPRFDNALCVQDGASGLTPIVAPAPTHPTLATRERYSRARDGSIAFDVETSYEESAADDLRSYLADVRPAEVSTRYLNAYAPEHPGIESRGALEIHDDRTANRVVVGEHYVIPNPDGFDWTYNASSLRPSLNAPRTVLRKLPLDVPHPLFLHHEIVLAVGGKPRGVPADLSRKSDALAFHRTSKVNGDAVTISYDLQSLSPSVAASDVEAHLRLLKELRSELNGQIDVAYAAPAPGLSSGEVASLWGFGVAVFGGLGGVVALKSKKLVRKLSWRRKLARKRGETPKAPLAVQTREAATAHLLAGSCLCGRRGGDANDVAWTPVRYEGGIVTSGRLPCACGERRVSYFTIAADVS